MSATTTITVFTAKSCQQCRMTEKRLAAAQLDFRIIRLENEPRIVAKLKSMGFMSAPVVQVTGKKAQMWTGFRPDLIDALATA